MSLTGLIFVLAFFAGCAFALIRHPIYGLMTYIAVFYLHPPSRWWGAWLPDLRWSLSAALVTLIAILFHRQRVAFGAVFQHGVMRGLLLFIAWITLQLIWALDYEMQVVLVSAYAKYFLLIILIYVCVQTPQHLRLILWTHVLGCVFLGSLVLTDYSGGRFEGFGGPDINEANSGALQVVTGIVTAGALFLAGRFKERLGVLGAAPLIINALVATVSRSGFLAAGVAGLAFNMLGPRKFKRFMRVASVLGIMVFVLLTNADYWDRIASIKHIGEDIEGMDTGAGRKELLEAQWQMFKLYPYGCGHRCTPILSTRYLDDRFLTGVGEERARSSHNTFMSLLVEQGVPGVVLYVALALWVWRSAIRLKRHYRNDDGFLALSYTAVVASLAAIFVGDLFVDYLKLEVRIWFIALMMVLLRFANQEAKAKVQSVAVAADPRAAQVAAVASGSPAKATPLPRR